MSRGILIEEFDPRRYHRFTYRGYSLDEGGSFRAQYSLSGSARSIDFTETVRFPRVNRPLTSHSHKLARLLALACGLSYYKTAAPALVKVEFYTSSRERLFLENLVKRGLGEFAFQNDLPDALLPEIVQSNAKPKESSSPKRRITRAEPLVPVGGGKDSVVTIESIKRIGIRPTLFSVNSYSPIGRCAEVSGMELLSAERAIDRKLVDLNKLGAYNGHVPVTAINSIIALLAADLLEIGPVVMSNERSAEYGNLEWNGFRVNHQWSKSLEFERLLRATLGDQAATYFSLMRPFSEIEIGRRFAQLPMYLPVFTSCNRSFKLDASIRGRSWCRACPKCQFVFLILAPFVSRLELENVFGGNVLEDRNNNDGYRDIVGLGKHKPFECVGEYSEAALALLMLADQDDWKDSVQVLTLKEELQRSGKTPSLTVRQDLLRPALAHHIPPNFQEALYALG